MKKRVFTLVLTLCLTIGLFAGLGIGAGADTDWTGYINCKSEIFVNLSGGTYTVGLNGPEIQTGTLLQDAWLGQTVYLDGVPSFVIPTRPAAPTGFWCDPYDEYSALLYGTSTDMQYRPYNETFYIGCPGNITTIYFTTEKSLRYYIRYKAIENQSLASYDAAVLVYTDKAGEQILEPDPEDDKPEESNKGYTDVSSEKWYYGAVSYVTTTGLMPGRTAKTFEPEAYTTREEVVTVLYNIAGEEYSPSIANGFTDVPEDASYLTAVLWGAENGIVEGCEDKSFGPEKSITREQLATFFYRLAKHMDYDTSNSGDLSSFDDSASVSDYASEAMTWAVEDGIIEGTDENKLEPQGTATRAHVAAMVQRFMKLVRPYF